MVITHIIFAWTFLQSYLFLTKEQYLLQLSIFKIVLCNLCWLVIFVFACFNTDTCRCHWCTQLTVIFLWSKGHDMFDFAPFLVCPGSRLQQTIHPFHLLLTRSRQESKTDRAPGPQLPPPAHQCWQL